MNVSQILAATQSKLPKNAPMRGVVQAINEVVDEFRLKSTWSFWFKESTFRSIAEYTTGTVSATQDSTSITGSGTTWTSAMTGRKIRIGNTESYTFTYVGATSGTISPAYVGESVSDKTYSIFQDLYAVNSDVDTIIDVFDMTNNFYVALTTREATQLWQNPGYAQPLTGRSVAVASYDASNNIQLLLSPPPTSAALYRYNYYKRPTAVTGPNDTPDIPTICHNAIVQGVTWKMSRDGEHEKDFRRSLEMLKVRDRTLLRHVSAKLSRVDGMTEYDRMLDPRHRLDFQTVLEAD
jgi:hypothetical protein